MFSLAQEPKGGEARRALLGGLLEVLLGYIKFIFKQRNLALKGFVGVAVLGLFFFEALAGLDFGLCFL